MRMQIYFNDKESDYIKTMPPGYVRSLVQQQMSGEPEEKSPAKATPRSDVKSKIILDVKNDKVPGVQVGMKGDGLHTCKKCGYMLPYYKGKCRMGCK